MHVYIHQWKNETSLYVLHKTCCLCVSGKKIWKPTERFENEKMNSIVVGVFTKPYDELKGFFYDYYLFYLVCIV